MYEVFEMKTSEEHGNAIRQKTEGTAKDNVEVTSSAASLKTVSLANEMRCLKLNDQDDSTEEAHSDAKDRFKEAREKATEAFCNEALSTCHRILAMQDRVMATLPEKVGNPSNAFAACRLRLEELRAMLVVQKSFYVQQKQGFKSWFNKAEREDIISSVLPGQ